MGTSASVDLFFHHYNRHVFETLINEAAGKYTTYVIMSGRFEGIAPLLDKVNGKVFLLDYFHPALRGIYSSVAQNFEKDTYQALIHCINYLKKYKEIIMVQGEPKEPVERYHGLCTFCSEHSFGQEYILNTCDRKIRKGEVYMVVTDRDLVYLIKQADQQGLSIGKDFGIISYNDTPLKEILAGGITTLSTDFTLMGATMASLIRKKKIETIENPWRLIIRKSL